VEIKFNKVEEGFFPKPSDWFKGPPAPRTDDDLIAEQIRSVPEHRSANLVVDLAATTDYRPSLILGSGGGSAVGEIVDLLNANTYTNVFATLGAGSGSVSLAIQTSDSTTSGTFTDPTSGLARIPQFLCSGGVFVVNSGLWVSGNRSLSAPVNNAPLACSGAVQFAAFLRPDLAGRYARMVVLSGATLGALNTGFIGNKKTTGSGGGFTFSPQTGTVNV
jgi:hypothetical protein